MLLFRFTMNSKLPFLPAAGSLIYSYKPAVQQWLTFFYPRGLWGK